MNKKTEWFLKKPTKIQILKLRKLHQPVSAMARTLIFAGLWRAQLQRCYSTPVATLHSPFSNSIQYGKRQTGI
jgi:hypothetical protein